MKMTKMILPAALLAAGAAQAQTSSVTLYGLMDLGLASMEGANTGVNASAVKNRQVINGALSTSHFGLRGTEDLGGGLAATFELSSFFRANTGQVGRGDATTTPVNVSADPFWSRQAWAGLGSTTFGRLRLGNSTTQLFFNTITSNAFADSTNFSPIVLVTFFGSALSGGTGWTNQIIYESPRFAGFSVNAAISASEGQGGRNGAVRAAYAAGPLAVSFAGQSVKKNPITFADGLSNNNTRSWQLAGSYDFSVVKVWAHLGRIDNRGTETTPLSLSYKIWDVSASVPLGAGKVLAGYAARKTSDTIAPVPATLNGGNIERKVLTVGYDHDLSKRTDVYALLMSDKTVTRTLPAPGSLVSASGTSMAVGVRHRF
jgi:predicted porin